MAYYRISPQKRSIFGSLSITSILVLVTVFAYFIFYILLAAETIPIDFIAIKPSNIFQGMYVWTFITSMFMHGGFFHLFVNMISLLFIGSLVERIIGRKRFFWFYMIAGIAAGLFFVVSSPLFPGAFYTFSVRASGP